MQFKMPKVIRKLALKAPGSVACVALLSIFLAQKTPVEPASDSNGFRSPAKGELLYNGVRHIPCDPGVSCYQDTYLYLNRLSVQVPRAWADKEKSDLAATIQGQFRKAAEKSLQRFTNGMPNGWRDLPDTICRSYVRAKSLVLKAPYFDDVGYCIRLIRNDLDTKAIHFTFPTQPGQDITMTEEPLTVVQFEMQIRASVSVSKNENSGYREATPNELAPYQRVLAEIAKNAKAELLAGLTIAGWTTSDDTGETYVAPKGLSLPKLQQ